MAAQMPKIGDIPVALFGIVLGLCGLGSAWRVATSIWGTPSSISEALLLAGAVVWVLLTVLYCTKWIVARAQAIAEARNPVACCFIGLIFVSTLLIANASLRYAPTLALILAGVGFSGHIAFSVWRTGQLWKGDREEGATTAVLYLPAVAGNFVAATVAANIGFSELAALLFGAGCFSWLAIESVLLHRLYTAPALPPPIRPTLGIQLAPPVVGCIAYLAIHDGPADLFSLALLGYGLFQAAILVRLVPWFSENAFVPGYWGFSFGATALATVILQLDARRPAGLVAAIALPVFAVVNLFILFLVVRTLILLGSGRLVSPTRTSSEGSRGAPV
jgi:tellurite resistance protein